MYLRLLVLIGFLASVLVGCTGPQPLPEAPTPIPTLIPATLPPAPVVGDATEEVSEVAASGDAAVEAGQEIWEQNCVLCHNLTTEKKVGPGLAGLWNRTELPSGKPFSEENLVAWIKAGGGAMPGFGSLSDQELSALVSFLGEATASDGDSEGAAAATASPTEEPEATATATALPTEEPEATATAPPTEEPGAKPGDTPPAATASGDVSNQTFDTICIACHNLSGEQKVGPGLAGLFDREELPSGKPVNDENLTEWIHTGGGAMPGFPNIEGEQLDELLAFLKEATKQ